MPKDKILIVDDDESTRWTLTEATRGWGYEVAEAGSVLQALAAFDADRPAVLLVDINLPDGTGLDVLHEIKRRDQQAVVIMITADVTVGNTLEALRGGAYDFIAKPFNLEELRLTIRNGIEAATLRREVSTARKERARQYNFEQLIGKSAAMKEVISLARKIAESEASSVLLQGESGTGKDLLAKAAHYASRRRDFPFVAINCAAIPATLIESELFGYEKGAFTDARARKEGLFEQAEGGTLFLDEIGELELSLQAKLLRVLEEGSFRRVGGLRNIPLDVRIIAASNRDLKSESEAGRFRLDLYYRLSVIQIDVPPLRERSEDVILLAEHLIEAFNVQLRKRVRGLAPEVADIFRRYSWPGNVRELRNVIERAMILEENQLITTTYLPKGLASATQTGEPARSIAKGGASDAASSGHRTGFKLPTEGISLDQVEMSLVEQALERTGGNQTRAAALLGISRDQLRYRLKKIAIDEDGSEAEEHQ